MINNDNSKTVKVRIAMTTHQSTKIYNALSNAFCI